MLIGHLKTQINTTIKKERYLQNESVKIKEDIDELTAKFAAKEPVIAEHSQLKKEL
jgi:hypothetical protein